MKKPIGVWVVSLLLCAVSFDGLLSFPDLLRSLQTTSQYLVAGCHVTYVLAGIGVMIGIWRSARSTWIVVIAAHD